MQAVLRRLAQRGSLGASACSTSGRTIAEGALGYSTAATGAVVKQEPIVLDAVVRTRSGTSASRKLREAGRIPGVVFSLPGETEQLLSLDAREVTRALTSLGRLRWSCTLFELRVRAEGEPTSAAAAESGAEPPQSRATSEEGVAGAVAPGSTVRALGRQAHVRADSDDVENVTFLACPESRRVTLEVPITLFGEEVCPGLKAGGRINRIRRTVPVFARGDAVPRSFEVDVYLSVGDKVLLSEVGLPDGVALNTRDPSLPILKIMRR